MKMGTPLVQKDKATLPGAFLDLQLCGPSSTSSVRQPLKTNMRPLLLGLTMLVASIQSFALVSTTRTRLRARGTLRLRRPVAQLDHMAGVISEPAGLARRSRMHVHVDDETIAALYRIFEDDAAYDGTPALRDSRGTPPEVLLDGGACHTLNGSTGLNGPDLQQMVISCTDKPDDPRMDCSAEYPSDGQLAEWVCLLRLEGYDA